MAAASSSTATPAPLASTISPRWPSRPKPVMSVQAPQPWAANSGTRGAWLHCIASSSASIQAGAAAPAMAAANSTPLPRGRLSSRASPGRSGPLPQWAAGATLPFTVRARASPAPSRPSRVWPPTRAAPRGSSTERTPARVCSSSSSCTAAAASGTVTRAWALSSAAPLAQRSLQACRVVIRPLSQGSSTRAGNPSTLCSSRLPSAQVATRAASSTGRGGPSGSSRARADARGADASLAAQPRQAMAAAAIGRSAAKRAMKARSMRCFHCQIHPDGPRATGPRKARARGPAGCQPPSPSSCRARAWGRQGRSGLGGSPRLRRRLSASSGAERTAHTPEGGRGSAAIRPQSPLANRAGWPITWRLDSVSTRPLAASAGRPATASQAGARLPVQARSAGASAGARRWIGMAAWASNRSPARFAAADPSCRDSPLSSSSQAIPRARKARASSTAAAPPPRITRGWPALRRSAQARKGSSGLTAIACPADHPEVAVTAPRSRLSRSKRRGGRPASCSSRAAGSSPVISA